MISTYRNEKENINQNLLETYPYPREREIPLLRVHEIYISGNYFLRIRYGTISSELVNFEYSNFIFTNKRQLHCIAMPTWIRNFQNRISIQLMLQIIYGLSYMTDHWVNIHLRLTTWIFKLKALRSLLNLLTEWHRYQLYLSVHCEVSKPLGDFPKESRINS